MLVLSRRVGESLVIADNIRVSVLAIQGHKIRLGIEAPRAVQVDRQEFRARMNARRAADLANSTKAEDAQASVLSKNGVNGVNGVDHT
jgi:carbon storage regulator